MNLCSLGHDEICFEGRGCPLCQEQAYHEETKTDLNAEIERLKKVIDELEARE